MALAATGSWTVANFCADGRGTCPTGRSGLPADLMHVCHLDFFLMEK
jgi:hypothetical protein